MKVNPTPKTRGRHLPGRAPGLPWRSALALFACVFATLLAHAQSQNIGHVELRFFSVPPTVTLQQLWEDLDAKGVLVTPQRKVSFEINPFTEGDRSLRGRLSTPLPADAAEVVQWEIRLSGKKYVYCTNSPVQRIYDGDRSLAAATFEVRTAWRPYVEAYPEPQSSFMIQTNCSQTRCTNSLDKLVPVSDSDSVTLELFHDLAEGQWVLPVEIENPKIILKEGKRYRGKFNSVRFLKSRQTANERNFVKRLLESDKHAIHVFDFNKKGN
jgi:hypothetical protein